MGVFRDSVLEWQGVDYTITPTNRLLRRIEGQGDFSLAALAVDIQKGQPKVSYIAFVLSELLKSGGARVTEDEMYQFLTVNEDSEAVMTLWAALFQVLEPEPLPGKKPAPAPVTKKSKAKSKSTGRATT